VINAARDSEEKKPDYPERVAMQTWRSPKKKSCFPLSLFSPPPPPPPPPHGCDPKKNRLVCSKQSNVVLFFITLWNRQLLRVQCQRNDTTKSPRRLSLSVSGSHVRCRRRFEACQMTLGLRMRSAPLLVRLQSRSGCVSFSI